MHRLAILLLVSAITVVAVHAQDGDRIGAADEFGTIEGWAATNPNTPATLEGDGESLILTDHEGGNATWGAAAFKTFRNVDVDVYPWLVVKVDRMTSGFAGKLAHGGEKVSVLAGLTEPGLIAENIAETTGWSGVIDINVGLYSQGDGSEIAIDYVRFVSELTEEERAAMPEQATTEIDIVPLSGLDELAARRGMAPLAEVPPYPSERFIYMDPVTHAWVWRMTDHPAIERHEYYDIPAWNADGSLMMFISLRGPYGYWLMDADGSNLRPVPEPTDGEGRGKPYWTSTDPDSVFTFRSDEDSTTILKMNVHDGAFEEVVTIPVGGLRMEPPHPDDRHFLFHRATEELWIVDGETGEYTHTKLWPTHRRRFTKAADLSLFINRDNDPETPEVRRRTSWTCTREGRDLVMLTDGEGGHPDWTPDGSMLGYYGSGGIWVINRDGTGKRLLVETSGGHGGFSFDGQWHVSDAPHTGPFREQLFVTHLETGRVHPIAFHHSSYSGWGSGVPDPEATHPAPIASPDSTKIVYDSDMMGQPDMWVAVWQYPQRPAELSVERDGGNSTLRWQRPERSKELAGYNVYRREAGEGEWQQIASLLTEPTYADADAGDGVWDYAVTAQEHSGLQSRMALAWGGERSVVDLEPEALALPEGAKIVLDHRCGDGWYVSAIEDVAVGLGEHPIDGALVWARMRDPQQIGGGWSASRGNATSPGALPGAEWQWLRAESELEGDAALQLKLAGGTEVDQVIITDDAEFVPVGIVGAINAAPAAPRSLSVTETTAIEVSLSWGPVEGAAYYRVYATREPEMELSSRTLVGTSEDPSFRDGGLTPATTYRYQVTAMDAWGNESEPTSLVETRTPEATWTHQQLDAKDAVLDAPMVFVADGTALSGGYVHVPDDYSDDTYVLEGWAEFTFDAPEAGAYSVWAHTMGLDGKSDSFFVKLDDREQQEWPVGRGREEPEWRWVGVATLGPVRLDAGRHTLRISCREDGTRLDRIIVTNDPFFSPEQE